MKIAKLVLMTPVLVTCLALAFVSTAQVKRARSAGSVLGTVSLRKGEKDEQKVKVFLDTDGVLSLGDKRVEKLWFEDGSVYLLGKPSDRSKPSDRREIKVIDSKIWAAGKEVSAISLAGYAGKPTWGIECTCYVSPLVPKGPPPPPPPQPHYPKPQNPEPLKNTMPKTKTMPTAKGN